MNTINMNCQSGSKMTNSTYQLDNFFNIMFGENEETILIVLSLAQLLFTILTFQIAFKVFGGAPYGRYKPTGKHARFGQTINGQLAWVIQEIPAFLWPMSLYLFTEAKQLSNVTNLICLSLYAIHYLNRTFVYSLVKKGQPMETFFCACVTVYVAFLSFITTRYLSQYAVHDVDYIRHPRFIIGCLMFLTGFTINVHSDRILVNLRKPGETGYKIPKGGIFEFVSGANFFGETVEWFGFALAAWNIPAFAFAFVTLFNIGPRAFQHHRFYKTKFEDYPKQRKAFIPFLL